MASEEQQWSIFDWVRNPPEVYAKMRASGPIHWNEDYKGWLVIDYDLARELLKDPRLSSDTTEALKLTAFPKRSREQVEPLLDLLRSWLIFSDPPYHTALRKVLNPYFAKSALAERAKSIEMHARNLLSNCEGEWDFMEKFAGPLPARVMADLMGLPYDAILDFLSWDAQLASFIGSAVRSPDVTAGALMAMRYQKQFFNQVIAAAAPDSFLVSLKSALEQEDLFSKDDFWKILSMILATGT
ncbi:MAG: cytochrome P450, partial [Coxiellaceae bacterium]|nr:cytochrome P450 [Coxiellaceae bacterium]